MALIAYLLLIIQIIFVIAEPIDEGVDVGKIIEQNGRKIVINPGQFPYIVHLEFRRYIKDKNSNKINSQVSNCGGALIRRDIVLTAAHCVGINIPKKPNVVAWLGVLDLKLDQGNGQEIPVRGYTVHKDYKPSEPDSNDQSGDDIALLWLVKPAKLNGKTVKLANLPTKDFSGEDRRGWIIGWGRQSNGRETSMLQKAVVRGVLRSKCQNYYQHVKVPANVICILSDDKQKTCTSGDSGGPFVIQNTIVGVSSFSAINYECKNEATGLHGFNAAKPAGYTYVPKFIDWIEEKIKQGPETILRKIEPSPPK